MFRYGARLIILIVIAALIFLWLIKAPIISNYLTKKLGLPVTMSSVSIWPRQTRIKNFRIANPHKYRTRAALVVDETQIDYRWDMLRKDPHEIDLITLDDVVLNIYINDSSGKDNNWADIGANVPEHKGNEEVIVHKLVMRNLTVVTEGPGADKLGIAGTRHFSSMEFDEIDSREGFPTKELIAKIFEGVGLKQLLDRFLNPTNYIKKAFKPFNKLFGKAPEVQGLEFED